jgi:raffinose/stachyose/melibiose transport system substrate-binding protein
MSLDRRELLRRSGFVTAGIAVGGSIATHTVGAQEDEVAPEGLVFWDTWNAPPRSDIADSLAESFAEAHDGIVVEHRGWQTEDLGDTLPRALEGGQGPDVAQINQGETLMGPLVRAGRLVSLNDYAEEYGWNDLMSEGLRSRNMYSEDGTQMGEGVLWGVPSESEIVGFYYNRAIFEEHGLSVPTTMAEFEELLAMLREMGVEPIAFGTLDQWQAIHIFGELHAPFTTREYIDDLIYRRNDASFDDQSIRDAMAKLVEWTENGYFLQGVEGLNGDDATPVFTSGGSAMLMQGSWAAGQVGTDMGDEAGFFLMPPVEAGGSVYHVGGVGLAYGITDNAEDPDLAAELINHLVSEEAINMTLDAGNLPIGEIPADRITEGTLSGELYGAWNSAVEADAVGHYLDWAAPDIFGVLAGELQKLMAGETDVDAAVAVVQEFYAASFES